MAPYPDANSPNLILSHPTADEKLKTWDLNYQNWGKAIPKHDYFYREQYLATVPLAADGGMTYWCLVDKNAPPNNRALYATCETIRKRAILSNKGEVSDVTIHSIGSVFCAPAYRGRKYASRMLTDLAEILRTWQIDPNIPGRSQIPASILFSDIGKKYYANHGWLPFPSSHIALRPIEDTSSTNGTSTNGTSTNGTATNGTATNGTSTDSTSTNGTPTNGASSNGTSILITPLEKSDMVELCALDVCHIRQAFERISDSKIHMALLPDHQAIEWHNLREDCMSMPIFEQKPKIKGAITGEDGSRIWAYWTRGYYGPIERPESGNTLHILRLVIESEVDTQENADKLQAILQFAQKEAAKWKMGSVEFWNPTRLVKDLLERTGMDHVEVEREEESVTSLMWYGEGNGTMEEVEWVGNEKYGWC